MKKHVSNASRPRAGGNVSKMCYPKANWGSPKDTSDGASLKEGYKKLGDPGSSPQARPLNK